MTTKEDEILRRFEHLEDLPIDDADYGKEFPILSDDEPSTCQRCGAGYSKTQFMALALPDDGEGVWTFETATLAVRRCVCSNSLARRIA